MNAKKVEDSQIEMRELILPNDTNLLGNLLGGRLLHWIDIAGAMAASRHSQSIVATASIDSVEFNQPVQAGEMIVLKSKLTWVGRTSMEVMVEVCSDNYLSGETKFTNRAYLIFVALDENGNPHPVPQLTLQTEQEKMEFQEALKRRKARLNRRKFNSCSQCK